MVVCASSSLETHRSDLEDYVSEHIIPVVVPCHLNTTYTTAIVKAMSDDGVCIFDEEDFKNASFDVIVVLCRVISKSLPDTGLKKAAVMAKLSAWIMKSRGFSS